MLDLTFLAHCNFIPFYLLDYKFPFACWLLLLLSVSQEICAYCFAPGSHRVFSQHTVPVCFLSLVLLAQQLSGLRALWSWCLKRRPHPRAEPSLARVPISSLWSLAGPLGPLRSNFCECLPHRVIGDIKQNIDYLVPLRYKLHITVNKVSILY